MPPITSCVSSACHCTHTKTSHLLPTHTQKACCTTVPFLFLISCRNPRVPREREATPPPPPSLSLSLSLSLLQGERYSLNLKSTKGGNALAYKCSSRHASSISLFLLSTKDILQQSDYRSSHRQICLTLASWRLKHHVSLRLSRAFVVVSSNSVNVGLAELRKQFHSTSGTPTISSSHLSFFQTSCLCFPFLFLSLLVQIPS